MNDVSFTIDNSNVLFDDVNFELAGNNGRFLSRIPTHFRGPENGDPIDFLISRRVDMRFEQTQTMNISPDVNFFSRSDVTFDEEASLVVNGQLQSNKEAEFYGDIEMVDVTLNIEGDLMIDGEDGDNNADITFRSGVEVRFYNDVVMEQNLNVRMETDLYTLRVDEETTIGGRLSCRKGATISGDTSDSSSITSMNSPQLLRDEGSVRVQKDLEVLEDSSFVVVDVNERASVRNLRVTGASELYSLAVEGGSTNLGSLRATSASVGGKVESENLEVTNDASVGGDLEVTGETQLGSAVYLGLLVSGDLAVTGDLTVAGTTNLMTTEFQEITVSGRATVGSVIADSASISGVATTGRLTVNNNAKVEGTLDVIGSSNLATTVLQDITVQGTAVVESLSVNTDAEVAGDMGVGGSIALADTVFQDLTVVGTATINTLDADSAEVTGTARIGTLEVLTNAEVSALDVTSEANMRKLTVSVANVTARANIDRLVVEKEAVVRGPFRATRGIASFADVIIWGNSANGTQGSLDVVGSLTVNGANVP